MRTIPVDILSDASNAAVIRHPDRRFPGVLVQGDTLSTLLASADAALRALAPEHPAFEEVEDLRDRLQGLLNHYVRVLDEHGLPLPFSR